MKRSAPRILSGVLRGVPHDLPAHPRGQNLDLADLYRVDGKDVVTEQDHIRKFAGRDRAFVFFLKFSVGGTHGIGFDGFRNC